MALAAIVSFSGGAGLAVILATLPLNGRTAQLAQSRDPLSNLPATLDHPINILVLGIDNSGHPHSGQAPPEAVLAGNSDAMMLVRLLPSTHQINILSIPRDTRVHIPGYGIDKINDANMLGGVKLASQAVSQLLPGISIDRYIRVDTEGLIHLVDALGGAEITIPKAMHYDDQSQNLHIHFDAGRQHLDGQRLEEYVRFRHDDLGDIGRVQRQQNVLKALLKTLLQPEVIAKMPAAIRTAQANVDTDLSLNDMLAIARFLVTADSHHANLVMLPGRFSRPGESLASYWISNPEATMSSLRRYFDLPTEMAANEVDKNPGAASSLNTEVNANLVTNPNATLSGDAAPQVAASASPVVALPPGQIRVAVENATAQPDAAKRVVALLRELGFDQAYVSQRDINASTDTNIGSSTVILAQQGDPNLANQVQQGLGIGQVQVAATGDIWSDVTVVIGDDLVTHLNRLQKF
jgi:LCP family protein required for cell wall assembly